VESRGSAPPTIPGDRGPVNALAILCCARYKQDACVALGTPRSAAGTSETAMNKLCRHTAPEALCRWLGPMDTHTFRGFALSRASVTPVCCVQWHVTYETERIWKEGHVLPEIRYRHFPGGSEENQEQI
jgi:hypothetical protein